MRIYSQPLLLHRIYVRSTFNLIVIHIGAREAARQLGVACGHHVVFVLNKIEHSNRYEIEDATKKSW